MKVFSGIKLQLTSSVVTANQRNVQPTSSLTSYLQYKYSSWL